MPLLSDRTLSLLDLDEAANRVVAGVPTEADVARAAERIAALGIPSAAFQVQAQGETVFASSQVAPWGCDLTPQHLQHCLRPVVAGTQIASKKPGMGGCTLAWSYTSYSGAPRFITAAHCAQPVQVVDYHAMYQSAPLDSIGWQIGTEAVDPPPNPAYTCYPARCADAAAFDYVPGTPLSIGKIARPAGSSSSWGTPGTLNIDTSNPYFFIQANVTGNLSTGLNTMKVGRTTGWTKGSITRTCVDLTVAGQQYSCEYESSLYCDEGDSGSPVFDWYYPTLTGVRIVGVLSAKNPDIHRCYFSSVSSVATDLGWDAINNHYSP